MKKAEEVLSGKKKKSKKTRYKHTHIEHHSDGSHTVRHVPHEVGGEEMSYAAPGMDELHAGIDRHVGAPPDEDEQQAPVAPGAATPPNPGAM